MAAKKDLTLKERVERLERNAGLKDSITRIFFLLDRSGSMWSIKGDTIGGFNNYLSTITEEIEGEARFTMAQFDSQGFDLLSEDCALKDAVRLDDGNYLPRSATPLVDSAMRLIKIAEDSAQPSDKVIIVIQTDGLENSSKEYKNNDLKAKVETIQGKGWAVNFIGAGIDAYSQSQQYGIAAGQTMSYHRGHSKAAFAATSRATAAYSVTGNAMDSSYTVGEKRLAGDEHAEEDKTNKTKEVSSNT